MIQHIKSNSKVAFYFTLIIWLINNNSIKCKSQVPLSKNSKETHQKEGHLLAFNDPLTSEFTHSESDKCEKIERERTGEDWRCVIYSSTDKFCSCEFKYTCGDQKKIYFSKRYSRQFKKLNGIVNETRGVDLQCELVLRRVDDQEWICGMYLNEQAEGEDDELYCRCEYFKECVRHKIVEFYVGWAKAFWNMFF